ncbi:hypothetical protein [Neptuniibacter sp. QD37_11]|uniref:hypothetical protein n=1 Tax=Neptuniibacter sp. QD37_11 TaxID=3398209 RepID=UPI0039F62F87
MYMLYQDENNHLAYGSTKYLVADESNHIKTPEDIELLVLQDDSLGNPITPLYICDQKPESLNSAYKHAIGELNRAIYLLGRIHTQDPFVLIDSTELISKARDGIGSANPQACFPNLASISFDQQCIELHNTLEDAIESIKGLESNLPFDPIAPRTKFMRAIKGACRRMMNELELQTSAVRQHLLSNDEDYVGPTVDDIAENLTLTNWVDETISGTEKGAYAYGKEPESDNNLTLS